MNHFSWKYFAFIIIRDKDMSCHSNGMKMRFDEIGETHAGIVCKERWGNDGIPSVTMSYVSATRPGREQGGDLVGGHGHLTLPNSGNRPVSCKSFF